MSAIQDFIDKYHAKKLQINWQGQLENLHVIDWSSIVEEHEALMEQIEDMEDEEAGEFLCDNESQLMQITENFMNDSCDEKVEDDKWLPFGLLGLPHQPEHFSETNHKGLLLLDLTAEKNSHYPVILFYKGKKQVIANTLDELVIQQVK